MRDLKRSRDEFEGDNMMGVADTLSRLREPQPNPSDAPLTIAEGIDSIGEWQKVESKRSKKRKKAPKQDSVNYPSISHSPNARLQTYVKISDLQSLILYLIGDGPSPQWCAVRHHANVKKVVALMVPGLEAGMFDPKTSLFKKDQEPGNGEAVQELQSIKQDDDADGFTVVSKHKAKMSPDDFYPVKLGQDHFSEALRPLGDMFEHLWPIRTPGDDKYAKIHSPLAAMLTVPLTRTKEEKKAKGPQPPSAGRNWKNHRTPVTEFLATTEDLLEENYTLHPAHFSGTKAAEVESSRRLAERTSTSDGWVDTPDILDLATGDVPDKEIESGSITAGRKVIAMDCEMCITSPTGQTPQVFSLTRVSVIDWDGKVILDELVKPAEPITDYLTAYSGITPALLENVKTTLADVQKKLATLITPQTILVGHSLNSDLNALRLTHPFIIDTTFLFPHPRGPPLKSSLKWLAQKYLSREIQKGHGSTGHDSIEDARACLDLVKQKCEKGKAWGTSEASGESIFKRLSRSTRPKRDKVNPSGDDEPRVGAVVDWGDPTRGYGAQAKVTIGCESDVEVVSGIKRALVGDTDSRLIPQGGCDFIWARFRELEAHRGWWDKSRNVDSEALRSSTATSVAGHSLEDAVRETVERIGEVYKALPPCTALIVYSGSADPRELRTMQAMQQQFKEEYRVKKWDELSVQWTDVEEQRLRRACETARRGIGFLAVK